MGTVVITLVPSANPHAGLAALPRWAIQLARAQSEFRIGMVLSRPLQTDRPATGRGRRAVGASVTARGRSAAETALAPGIAVTDAAVRLLAYFDRPAFAAFQGTTSGLRSARESFVPLDEFDPTGIYGAFAEEATSSESFTQRGCPLVGTAAGLRASISFIDLPGCGVEATCTASSWSWSSSRRSTCERTPRRVGDTTI